jgi:hypothetical protein
MNQAGVAVSPFTKTIQREKTIMTIRIDVAFFSALAMLLLISAATAFPMAGQGNAQTLMNQPATGLVQTVRLATAKYQNVSQALKDGYQADANGCVSSPDEGAMGVHYIKGSLIDGAVDASHPEGLVYEPGSHGQLQLVAVEYITIAELWDNAHQDGSPAKLMGQEFDYMEAPNRFRLPAVYNLHVWAWKNNPMGVFSMWNPNVSCANYTE